MEVAFRQVYIDVAFPFSHHFQKRLSEAVTGLICPSDKLRKRYHDKHNIDFSFVFNVSAKKALSSNEIRGPSVSKHYKVIEYTIFLPFTEIMKHSDAPRWALRFLLKGVCEVFQKWEIDTKVLRGKQEEIIEGVCADPLMLAGPQMFRGDDHATARSVFRSFFEENPR